MQPDPARVAETREWLTKAAQDLRAAAHELTAGLTEFAWKFRYPGEPDEPLASEAQEALELAREVYTAVMDRLPPDVRP